MSSPADDVVRDLGRILDALALDWYLFGAQAAFALVRAGAELSDVEPMVEAVAEGLGEDDVRHALAEVKRRVGR